ncbi:hypothetical protein Ae201684P_010801 [Aphanomyces euteiches]|uniref:Glycoside hydrolase family 6 protein n=1 Tax=Aphanomyces euteiches TaxID=100861 RepID=A0A6G0W6G7_9STRA|nr:hypothetical protein Ae201684_018183 [Aphanomyces euteiches]KAH9076870.1 hypothetical protein Ae201684P_010801 [Aphanomyces euteiches]
MKPSTLAFAAAVAATAFVSSVSSATICSAVKPYAYTTAAKQYPELKNALEVMKTNAIATWYIDTYNADIKGLLAACTNAIPSIVIYGLPNKDCGPGGFSQGGGNKNTADYSAWIQKLVDVGDREVIYILEPDAIGFASRDTGCGATYNYAANLKVAVGLLSANKNAHLYVDLSPWATQASAVKILKDLMAAGNLAGLALNTDQYLSNDKLTKLCQTYSTALGGNLHCVFDTSRNYNGFPQSEWCNARSGGVGLPPTDQTATRWWTTTCGSNNLVKATDNARVKAPMRWLLRQGTQLPSHWQQRHLAKPIDAIVVGSNSVHFVCQTHHGWPRAPHGQSHHGSPHVPHRPAFPIDCSAHS